MNFNFKSNNIWVCNKSFDSPSPTKYRFDAELLLIQFLGMRGDIPGICLPGSDPAIKLHNTVRKRKLLSSLSDLKLQTASVQWCCVSSWVIPAAGEKWKGKGGGDLREGSSVVFSSSGSLCHHSCPCGLLGNHKSHRQSFWPYSTSLLVPMWHSPVWDPCINVPQTACWWWAAVCCSLLNCLMLDNKCHLSLPWAQ